MGGIIPGGDFLGGNFPGGSLMGGNFPGGSFPDTINNRWRNYKWTLIKTDCHIKFKQTLSPKWVFNVNERTRTYLFANFKTSERLFVYKGLSNCTLQY